MFLDDKMQEVADFLLINSNARKHYFQGEDADTIDKMHEFGYINITHEGRIIITQKLLSEL